MLCLDLRLEIRIHTYLFTETQILIGALILFDIFTINLPQELEALDPQLIPAILFFDHAAGANVDRAPGPNKFQDILHGLLVAGPL